MDLEEYRERARQGKLPNKDPTVDAEVERLRDIFEANRKYYTKMGSIGISMLVDPSKTADRIFIEWLASTTHDMYVIYREGSVRCIAPLDTNKYEGLIYVTFFQKGATLEEIAKSSNAKWAANAVIVSSTSS